MSKAHFTGTSGTPDSTTSYFMGGQFEVKDGATKKYYSIAGMMVATQDASGLQYLLTDHPSVTLRTSLGSTVAVTNASGTLTSQQRYLPPAPARGFGAARTIPNSPLLGTDFTYTGQRKLDDGMGGIMDYRARFYSPQLGRFIQPDSIIPDLFNPQSWNRFSYVINGPVNLNDPTGHMFESDDYRCRGCTVRPDLEPDDDLDDDGGEGSPDDVLDDEQETVYSGTLYVDTGLGVVSGLYSSFAALMMQYRIVGNNFIISGGSRTLRNIAGFNPYTNRIGIGNLKALFSGWGGFKGGYASSLTWAGVAINVLGDIGNFANGIYDGSDLTAAILVDTVSTVGFAAVSGAVSGLISGAVAGAVGGTVIVPGIGTVSGAAVGAVAGAVAGLITGVALSYGFNNYEVANGQTMRDAAISSISSGIDSLFHP
ncbi:MAG TPA: RHS repeat-associated core domain-containing protein [Anaerolineales bacterium]|nr:RHS repeat-associated core domain-containing protein [Anaerolineales bacterium]HNS59512.1 RHS repeat-associated core domain-containing protein [Anaerolineales bacterium]